MEGGKGSREDSFVGSSPPSTRTLKMSSSNPFDRFRGGGDLAAFFRSLATPSHRFSTSTTSSSNDYEWDTTRSTGRLKLEFFDQGLNGAAVVLKALEENPHATSITLAQNELRDAGLLAFLMGLKRLRHQGIGGHLQVRLGHN